MIGAIRSYSHRVVGIRSCSLGLGRTGYRVPFFFRRRKHDTEKAFVQRTPVVGRLASGSHCRVFWLFKKHTNGMGRLSCRSKCSYILRPGRAGRTGTYDRIQYFVRDPVFPVRLLWGNDYLFGDERAHGSSIHGFLAASPL